MRERGDSGVHEIGMRFGRRHELDLLGEPDLSHPSLKEALSKVTDASGYGKRHELIDAIIDGEQSQPNADAENPGTDFLRELRLAVMEQLGVRPDAKDERVGIFTALGTPLDFKHGVDAFLVLTSKGRRELVTLDATLNKEKANELTKADIVIGEIPSVEEDEDAYLEAVEGIAAKVSKKLLSLRDEASRGTYRAA
jgi:hypothetical protein